MHQTSGKTCKHPTCGITCRRPTKSKAKKTRIPPVSKKQAKRNRTYVKQLKKETTGEEVCAIALLENKTDEIIKLFQDCQYWGFTNHHQAGRGGDRLYRKGVRLCVNCHRIIENKPVLAKELGLSESRLINH